MTAAARDDGRAGPTGPQDADPSSAGGALLAAAAALAYAVTIVIGRSLADDDLGGRTVLGIRFTGAALATFAVLALRRVPLVPPRGERLAAFLLGAIGYMAESTFFFAGLERGTAAAVALLFYAYPTMVVAAGRVLGQPAPPKAGVAVVLSVGGTALVVAAGADVSISRTGVLFALASAVGFTIYMLTSDRLIVRTPAMTTAAWVATGAGISFLVQGAATATLHDPGDAWPALAANAAVTAVAFTCMFAALPRIGAARTSVIMTLEAVFAIVLAALFLGEGIRPLQAVGGAAVLAGAVVIARRPRPVVPEL